MQAHASITTEGKEVLTAQGVGLGVEVGVSAAEEGKTTIDVLDGVEGRTTVIVLTE
jgi:hypothetical protein